MTTQMISGWSYTCFKKIITYKVGKKYMGLYPKRTIGENWPNVETNLSLNVNKTALLTSEVCKILVIDTLEDRFGTTTQEQIHFQKNLALTRSQVHNPANLQMISYHSNDGSEVPDTITVGDLKAIATRPGGLCFAKIRYNFDFVSITYKN